MTAGLSQMIKLTLMLMQPVYKNMKNWFVLRVKCQRCVDTHPRRSCFTLNTGVKVPKQNVAWWSQVVGKETCLAYLTWWAETLKTFWKLTLFVSWYWCTNNTIKSYFYKENNSVCFPVAWQQKTHYTGKESPVSSDLQQEKAERQREEWFVGCVLLGLPASPHTGRYSSCWMSSMISSPFPVPPFMVVWRVFPSSAALNM